MVTEGAGRDISRCGLDGGSKVGKYIEVQSLPLGRCDGKGRRCLLDAAAGSHQAKVVVTPDVTRIECLSSNGPPIGTSQTSVEQLRTADSGL